jgi:hypothetical protein
LVYVNWPYSNPRPWAIKCRDEAEKGADVVALCKMDTSVGWWNLCKPAGFFAFRKRMAYGMGGIEGNKTPFPTALLVWTPNKRLERELEPYADWWAKCSY